MFTVEVRVDTVAVVALNGDEMDYLKSTEDPAVFELTQEAHDKIVDALLGAISDRYEVFVDGEGGDPVRVDFDLSEDMLEIEGW